LGTPPADLITACASGRMMLWAGAGLSAQSGFPVRAKFIATLIQMAAVEFDDLVPLKKLKALCESGKTEAALNELVMAMAAHRGEVLSEFTGIFARFSPPSRSHELLARLNLHSAVTTNYDVLLERMCDAWASNVRHLGEDVLSGRFLLKLYGSLSAPPSVLLSRAEFLAALNRPNIEMLRQVFATQPMLFVGCSLEALLADLAMMGMPEGTNEIRFAIAGVSGSWEKPAEELLRRYGIQTLACSEEQIGQELPRFLQLLQTRSQTPAASSQNQAAAASG
jgi:hypothetical protein